MPDAAPQARGAPRAAAPPPEVVVRAQRGDLGAFAALYREHVSRVFAVVRRLCSSVAQAEELTQEVFVRAFERLSTFRGDSAFGTWLHRLAINVVLEDRRKTERRDRRVTLSGDPASVEDHADRTTSERGVALDLERAVAALPEGARTVLVLHDVEGYQHDEIAAHLGVTTGTTKAQLHRARKLMREALDR